MIKSVDRVLKWMMAFGFFVRKESRVSSHLLNLSEK